MDLASPASIAHRAERWLRPVDFRAPLYQELARRDPGFRPEHIVGPGGEDSPAIEEIKKGLRSGDEVSEQDLKDLQKAVRALRPALAIRSGRVPDVDGELLKVFPEWPEFRAEVQDYLGSIARLVREEPLATAFIVAPDLVMTNRHVVTELTKGTNRLGADVSAEFGAETPDVEAARRTAVTGLVAVHEFADLALLRIEPNGRPVIPFDLDVADETPVAAVGFPVQDDQAPEYNDMFEQEGFGVERVSPGEVMELRGDELFHDCTTLQGNSGSPVFSLASGKVVAVHREGYFLERNEAVLASTAVAFVAEYT